MKNIFLIAMALLMISFVACKRDYLDRLPDNRISESEVFGDINNAEDFVNNIYNQLPNWAMASSGNAYTTSSGTDEGKQTWLGGMSLYLEGNYTPSQIFPFSPDWFNFYNGIEKCNSFLGNYSTIPNDPNHPRRKDMMKGEVLTLRAYFYFCLFKRWGEIPLLNRALAPYGSDDIYLKRSSYQEVVNFIISDLDSASQYLPFNYSADPGRVGRATKMVDFAIKSRVLLFFASPLFNPQNSKDRWENAASAASDALQAALNNGYSLSNNYADIFSKYMNQEVIWNRPMTRGDWGPDGIDRVMQPIGYGGWNNSGPIQEFVNSYEMKKTGLPINNPASGFDPNHPYSGRDPRFYATVLYPGEIWKGRPIDPKHNDAATNGQIQSDYWWKKYITESLDLNNGNGYVPIKWILFRTSELYLNYAEAQNEAVGPDQSVYNAINAIRTRAGMPNLSNGLNQDEMKKAIRHERKIELAFEGHRFWDVLRWKIADSVDNVSVHGVDMTINGSDTSYSFPVIQKRQFDPSKNYLLPIPQSEMDKMSGKNPDFKQTPGW